ncbi:sulfotransferase 1C2A [Lingula anatina]|uniref:Sulfotransferase 1C2A n=1 Tax=Lingula anatina TaxID=7574 RepID=A0A1S3IQW4_LINAN|nr:sulfotransferase 1C2A [Lingula anatina]XP_013400597.1 sulfotransferase 1C2A [Lingula anatina]|eukprot:XP_013400596.1 sulfotransferase 1C2A [Lingula anatina]
MPVVKVKDGEGHEITWNEVRPGEMYCDFPGIEERLAAADKFEARPDDVWVSTYPKSGTHWTWEIVHMLINGNAKINDIPKTMGFFEERDQDHLDNIPSPRVLDTHLSYHRIPPDVWRKNCKIVYVMRNPKDVAVSFYNHSKGIIDYKYEGTWNGFFKLFTEGPKFEWGMWWENVLSWWENARNKSNVLFLTYEEMIKDSVAAVRKIAEFIGRPGTEELYKAIADACAFDKMKTLKTPTEPKCWKGENLMYRKGKVGDWKNWFTVAQNEHFDILHEERTKGTGIKLEFEI